MIKSPSRLVSVLAVAVLLVACGSRISQENFNRIADGMPYADVVKILGEPTSSEARGVLGVSATTAKWKDQEHLITIVFVNQNVKSKSFRAVKDASKE